jgi:hypothetical protein
MAVAHALHHVSHLQTLDLGCALSQSRGRHSHVA